MIAHLKGIIDSVGIDHIVVDVQGVGYMIYMPTSLLSRLRIDDEIKAFTHHHVRDDLMQLYGFLEKNDLEVFKMLLGVSGVGPKVGLAVLSQCSCEEIVAGIDLEKPEVFTKVTGIGKKTAQRILLDLKDKTKNLPFIAGTPITTALDPALSINNNVIEETLSALISLGYSSKEVTEIVYGTAQELDDNMTVEELLNKSLKKLAAVGR